jgi:hydrogenase maturation protease
MPELAEQLAGVELAVFVDTAAGTPAGSVRIVPQRATALPASGFVHHLDPGALLLLAERLYGRAPEAFLVTVGAASLAIGEGLSPAAAESLPVAVAAVRRLIAEHLPENARWPAAPGSAP